MVDVAGGLKIDALNGQAFLGGSRAALRLDLGDANKDGLLDLTVQAGVRLPLVGPVARSLTVPFPEDTALAIAEQVTGLLPAQAAPVAKIAVGFLRVVLRAVAKIP